MGFAHKRVEGATDLNGDNQCPQYRYLLSNDNSSSWPDRFIRSTCSPIADHDNSRGRPCGSYQPSTPSFLMCGVTVRSPRAWAPSSTSKRYATSWPTSSQQRPRTQTSISTS